jgi:ComF family protein
MHNICPHCRLNIPTTNYWLKEHNPAKERFDGLLPIYRGSSFFFFKGNSLWRTIIHRFKYGGMWQIAYNLGRWYGAELKESSLYDDVDIIIPLPLHPIKSIKRGYNQSRYIADGIAKELGADVESHAVRRIRNNPSQARRKRRDRWEGVDDLFRVVKPEKLRGKHILIVDDVISTGESLTALETLVSEVGGEIVGKMAVLAEGDAAKREDIIFLEPLPLFHGDGTPMA